MNHGSNAPRETDDAAAGWQLHARELETVAASLEQALRDADLSIFYDAFRASGLPFLCGTYRDNTALLYPACVDIMLRLGGISPAVALAVENHFYVTSAIATFPSMTEPALEARRQRLLDQVVTERLLVANTNSKVHSGKLGEIGTAARRDRDGFRVDGTAAYASLATEADLLVLLTELRDEGAAIFTIPSPDRNPTVEIGDYLFPSAMLDSDTRSVTFHDTWLPADSLVTVGQGGVAGMLLPFQMAWHQLLIPALYLGAARRAIEEVCAFLRSTKGRDGRPLAELDGMVVDVGRLALAYQDARCLVDQAGQALSRVQALPRDQESIDEALALANAAKYCGARAAESIVTAARRIVGARAFAGNSPLERLSQEVMFATLGPEVSAVIERRFGERILKADAVPRTFLP